MAAKPWQSGNNLAEKYKDKMDMEQGKFTGGDVAHHRTARPEHRSRFLVLEKCWPIYNM